MDPVPSSFTKGKKKSGPHSSQTARGGAKTGGVPSGQPRLCPVLRSRVKATDHVYIIVSATARGGGFSAVTHRCRSCRRQPPVPRREDRAVRRRNGDLGAAVLQERRDSTWDVLHGSVRATERCHCRIAFSAPAPVVESQRLRRQSTRNL